MKNNLLKLLTIIMVLCFSLGTLFACSNGGSGQTPPTNPPGHTHSFTERVTEEEYLYSIATCQQKAKYFYSCECGAKGTETFESGKILKCEYVDGKCKWCKEGFYSKGLKYVLINNATEYEVSGIGTCTDTEIIIPAVYKGKPVTSIDTYAFLECSSLISIVIPNNVTSIGGHTFYNCYSLKSIEIPNSVTSIGLYAFSYCRSLKSVVIPNSVTSIGSDAFSYCTSLTSIEIPNSVTSIDYFAFSNCTSLTSIKFNGTVSEWNSISKSVTWNDNTPATEVVCTDGSVALK